MGDQADDILLSFQLSEEDKKKYDVVLTKFQGHFVKRRNVIYERMKFNQRIQQEGESVESFVTDLYALSETCNYGELTNEMIHDRIVVGIRDDSVAERLQIDHELTLDKAISIARQGETLKKQQPTVRMQQQQEVVSVEPVDVKRQPPTKKNFNSVPRSPRQSDAKKTHQCSRCGRSPPHPKTQCPAREAVCRKCSKKGHFQIVCCTVKTVGAIERGEDDIFLGTVYASADAVSMTGSPWVIDLTLNGRPVQFKIDTGADVTVIGETDYNQVRDGQLQNSKTTLSGPSQRPLEVLGKFQALLRHDDRETKEDVFVIKGL